jgi:hypothetical protein
MPRVSRLRLTQLERQMQVNTPPIGRLFFLIPDLWPEVDREAFFNPERGRPWRSWWSAGPGCGPSGSQTGSAPDPSHAGGSLHMGCGDEGGVSRGARDAARPAMAPAGARMRLATRPRTLETMLRPEDEVPRLLIVFEEADGVWHDERGAAIDPCAVDPRTQVIRFRQRPDGPQ